MSEWDAMRLEPVYPPDARHLLDKIAKLLILDLGRLMGTGSVTIRIFADEAGAVHCQRISDEELYAAAKDSPDV